MPGGLPLLEFSVQLGPSEDPWGPIEHVHVDNLTKIFEQANGCKLHRDPATKKVKLLPLGGWRGKLKQSNLPAQCSHVSIADHLNMLGLPLYATISRTLREV